MYSICVISRPELYFIYQCCQQIYTQEPSSFTETDPQVKMTKRLSIWADLAGKMPYMPYLLEQKGGLTYVVFLKRLKCIWRVCFFHPSHSLALSFFIWLHKKASCEPSSLNEKHVAGIQNSGVFQHSPGRHLFLVCTAKSWSSERGAVVRWGCEGGGQQEKSRKSRKGVQGCNFPEQFEGNRVGVHLVCSSHKIIRLFFTVWCHLSRLNSHSAVSVNVLTWPTAPVVTRATCLSFHVLVHVITLIFYRSRRPF